MAFFIIKAVLIVEDDGHIANLILDTLKQEGFTCSVCVSASETRAILQRNEFDIIILDIGLPDGNGFDLCKEIRKDSDIPIVFLTGRSDEIDRVLGLEIGGDDYITKPFSPRELIARIKAIERRIPDSDRKHAQKWGKNTSFQVDVQRHAIHYLNSELKLSRYEYLILKVLVSHPGWIFSREKLMSLVWQDSHASDVRTVDTHIKSIRAKLKAIDAGQEPIVTKRGVGYSLKEDT
jgi:two-component system catabolic regulation response regulator CreB